MTNRRQPFIINFLVNPVLTLRTNRLPRYLGVSVLYERMQRLHDDRSISMRSHYGFLPVRCRNQSKKSHDGRIKCKYIHRTPQLLTMPTNRTEIPRQMIRTAPVSIVT